MLDITIRRLTTAREFDQAVELQKTYWGEDASNLVPRHMMHSLAKHGGHLLGAYRDEALLGLVIGFIGTANDNAKPRSEPAAERLLIMSKRMLVLPQYRGQSIGFALKMAQRDFALNQSIPLVTWTFDPLLAPNAHLNIRKLGGVIQGYVVNYFALEGTDTLTSDRLIVEWWVGTKRVRACAAGNPSRISLHQHLEQDTPVFSSADECDPDIDLSAEAALSESIQCLVEIPANILKLEATAPRLAQRCRQQIREIIPQLLCAGYSIADFVHGEIAGNQRSFYVLKRPAADNKDKTKVRT